MMRSTRSSAGDSPRAHAPQRQRPQDAGRHEHANGEHGEHDHAAMIADFRLRFWVSLALTLPILLLSPLIQAFLGFEAALAFSGDRYVLLALASGVYLYGGWPFLTGLIDELSDRAPGMMTLIALALTLAYGYSAAVVLGLEGKVFFWELATLVDVMLLGHWIEMRSVMGASGALQSLVAMLPDKALADLIRVESRAAVQRLKEMGIDCMMLTGDAKAVAKSVARQLVLEDYFAETLPDDKAARIEEVQRRGRKFAMVGDGVNDAPALLQADLGIAIGAGTDVAVESSDIVLVHSDPRNVADVMAPSRATYGKMMQNLLWATGYNAVAIPLAAGAAYGLGIMLSPAVGAALVSLSTVIVAINTKLLQRFEPGTG
jgi:cation transport ATPase